MTPTDDDKAMIKLATNTNIKPITSTGDYLHSTHLLLKIKAAQAHIEQREQEILAPMKQLKGVVDSWFGEAKRACVEAEDALKDEIVRYIDERVPQAADESKRLIDAGDTLAALEAMVAVPEVEGIQLRVQVDFDVVDLDLVPDEYLKREPRVKQIQAALRRGESIPGIKRRDRTALSVSRGTK